MNKPDMIGVALFVSLFWGAVASACVPYPFEFRKDGESDTDYRARVVRQRAEMEAAAQAAEEALAPIRENNFWDNNLVTRIAVVDVVGVVYPDNSPSNTAIDLLYPTVDFLFSTAMPERGMERNEHFALTELSRSFRPCIPIVTYPVGTRYILFASDGPISRSLPLFLLVPALEVRSERGLVLLRAAEQARR
jgi:hypothetical protein